MKKILFSLILTLIVVSMVFSQNSLDVKIRPMPLFVKMPNLALEYNWADNFGTEVRGMYLIDNNAFGAGNSFGTSSFLLDFIGKYYPQSKVGTDGFYGGLYLSYQSGFGEIEAGGLVEEMRLRRGIGGISVGYKWVGTKNLTLEVGAGFGRAFYSKLIRTENIIPNFVIIEPIRFDFLGQISIGYRINRI